MHEVIEHTKGSEMGVTALVHERKLNNVRIAIILFEYNRLQH